MLKRIEKDQLLWDAFISGEKDAFEAIYNCYIDSLFSYGTGLTNDRELIKDSIHDLFVDLYKYRKKLSSTNNIKSYLFASLRRKIHLKLGLQKGIQLTANFAEEYGSFMLDSDLDLDEEEKELLIRIQSLALKQREALYLKYLCGMSYEEISKMMNISIPSARTQIYRAIKSLRMSYILHEKT